MKIKLSILIAVLSCLLLTSIVSGDVTHIVNTFWREMPPEQEVLAIFPLEDGNSAYLSFNNVNSAYINLTIVHKEGGEDDTALTPLINNSLPKRVLISACNKNIHILVNWADQQTEYLRWEMQDHQIEYCKEYTVFLGAINSSPEQSMYPAP